MHTLGAARCPHIDFVIFNEEVRALNKRDTHFIGKERVFVIGAVEVARRQDDTIDVGVLKRVCRRDTFHRLPQQIRIRLNRGDISTHEKFREKP